MITPGPRPHALPVSPRLRRDPKGTSLSSYLSPSAFWEPDCIVVSAWLEHAPFAFWLVEFSRPNTIVELGTHGGLSYFAFCQAVKTLELDTQCHAVDNWKGDEHSGFYEEQVFTKVRDYNELRYDLFSHRFARRSMRRLLALEVN